MSSPPPLYATPRDPSRPTEGAAVARIAEALGTPLLPWQREVVDTACELNDDGSYRYPVVVVSVPRQCGKTTLLRAVGLFRALAKNRDVYYTAQTGKDARARWLDLVSAITDLEPFRSQVKAKRIRVQLSAGAPQVVFPGGAVFGCFAPGPQSLHGETAPTVMVDEAFAQTQASGELLMGALKPTQITCVDRQLWIVSTMGTAQSVFLHDWIDRGIEGAPGVACFVYGARDDQDPFNLEDIEAFHPGVGQVLNGNRLTAADVLDQAEGLSRAEYVRAFGNRRTVTSSHLIPLDDLRALYVADLPSPTSSRDVVLVYDVQVDRKSAAIGAAWNDGGRVRYRLLKAGPGTGWVAGAVAELRDRLRPSEVLAPGSGPVLDVTQQLENVRVLTEREYATACGAFLTAIAEQTFEYGGSAAAVQLLEQSVVGLVTRAAVTDGVAFSRRHSVGDSSPGITAALATWAAARNRTAPAPATYFGKAAS